MRVVVLPDGAESVTVLPAGGGSPVFFGTADIAAGTGIVDSVVAGTGIAVDSSDPANPVVSNTGVLDVAAGTGITVGGTAQHPTVTNDGVLDVAAGTGITVGGTAQHPTVTNDGVLGVTASGPGMGVGGTAQNPVVVRAESNKLKLDTVGQIGGTTYALSMTYTAAHHDGTIIVAQASLLSGAGGDTDTFLFTLESSDDPGNPIDGLVLEQSQSGNGPVVCSMTCIKQFFGPVTLTFHISSENGQDITLAANAAMLLAFDL